MGGSKHKVKVIGGGAELEERQDGRKLLRIWITAEVNGVQCDYEMMYSRRKTDNTAVRRATASADAPGDREADAERLAAVIKALTGVKPKIRHMKDGEIKIVCGREHLDGFTRYDELAEAIEKWLEETRGR